MTKTKIKKPAPGKIKEITENTGIFNRRTRTAHSSDPQVVEQMCKEICAQSARALDDIAELERQMKDLLRELPKLEKLPPEATKWVKKDAETAIGEFHALRAAFETKDVNSAVRHALRGMQAVMRAGVGLAEPVAKRGKEDIADKDLATKNRHASDRKAEERALQLGEEHKKRHPLDPGSALVNAVRATLKQEGHGYYTPKTVRGWLVPIYPKQSPKGGRPRKNK